MITLEYLPTNCAYAFLFGDSLLRLEDKSGPFPMFYQSRAEAVAAAESCGIRAAIVTARH